MDKEQLIGYISQAAKEGKQKQEIITELKLEGYAVPDIEDAYNTWENPPLPAESNSAGTFDSPADSPAVASAEEGALAKEGSSTDLSAEAVPPNFPPPPPSHPHYRLFLIVGIALLLLSGGLIFALRQRSTPQPAPPTPIPTPTIEAASPTPTPSVADCDLLDRDACMEEHFRSCSPAAYTNMIERSPSAETIRHEIIGKRGGSCLVKSTVTQHPDPEWIEKDMTCKLDNSKDFFTATEDISVCSGPLYDLMQQGE